MAVWLALTSGVRPQAMGESKASSGWIRISDACAIARTNGYRAFGKTRSELSETVNATYAWYEAGEVCCTYLADAPSVPPSQPAVVYMREDTLQELVARRR